jgi:hypothetical protein
MKSLSTIIGFLAICVILAGCGESQQSDSDQNGSSKKNADSDTHPNLSLHKPKSLSVAVLRLKEMHEALVADGDFPAPKTIKYVEVIHGQGASGHSHFYSAADYEANGGDEHDDDHEEEHEKVEHRSMEIDLRTELTDITGWLPDIAADSNLNETEWNSVEAISDRLSKIIGTIAADESDSSFRESWKLKSKEVESMLGDLEKFVDSSGTSK